MNFIGSLDLSVLLALFAMRDQGTVQLFIWISELGSTMVIGGLAVCAALLFASRGRLTYLAGLIMSVVGSAATVFILKEIIHRARPDALYQAYAVTDFSFPSGHATMSLALYGFLAYVLWNTLSSKVWRIVAVLGLGLLIALISFSRLYLGVHYLSDVAGGLVIGSFFLSLAVFTSERLWRTTTIFR